MPTQTTLCMCKKEDFISYIDYFICYTICMIIYPTYLKLLLWEQESIAPPLLSNLPPIQKASTTPAIQLQQPTPQTPMPCRAAIGLCFLGVTGSNVIVFVLWVWVIRWMNQLFWPWPWYVIWTWCHAVMAHVRFHAHQSPWRQHC